ncbi:Rpn family recombination-promoting nuclease/putative transposase [Bacteroides sp.]
MERQERYIRFDWAVRKILRQKANFGVLESFLAILLNEKVTIIGFLENENNRQMIADEIHRVNIKALNSRGENIIVEIQNTRKVHYLEHILRGAVEPIAGFTELGGIFSDVKKVYFINILYFDLGWGTDYLYHGQNNFIGVHTGDRLEVGAMEKDAVIHKLPAEVFPEYFLIGLEQFNKVAVTPLEEWIEYLKTGCIRPDTKVPGLEEARQILRYYNMTPEERRAYDEHLSVIMIQNDVLDTARLEGRMEGIEERKQEGREKESLRIARNMKAEGLDVALISKITGLTSEQIASL